MERTAVCVRSPRPESSFSLSDPASRNYGASLLVKFSIITPSFRNSHWLKLCIASVADQQGVEVEHIVQDAVSDDGTLDWLQGDTRVKAFIEKDSGMYDAINRGFGRASGDILAYLNCDEQYLPGALAAVAAYFEQHRQAEVVISDTVIVDGAGEYLSHRYALRPLKSHLWLRFPVLSSSLFLRRSVVEERGIVFDTQWRALGDLFWVKEMLDRGVRMDVLRRFTSTFTETGENLALSPTALSERQRKLTMAPAWVKRAGKFILLHHKLRMLLSGIYFQRPFDYAIYTQKSPAARMPHHVSKPNARWRR